jgi:2,3-bisphosphoglycerate-dependent phosphoglycerate mutase
MGELLLIRHAETDFNRQLRFQGHVDAPLNANGLAQAERLAERLADEPIDLLVTSDLLRARQTAAPWVARRGLRPVTDARWREQAFGVLEGLDAPTIRARHPELWAAWVRREAEHAPPGGESQRAFFERVWQALRELVQAHAGARIAVVTHGGALDMVWRGVHGLPPAGPRACAIPNTGLNRLRSAAPDAAPERFLILRWADADHLAGMPLPPIHYPTSGPTAAAEAAHPGTAAATRP